MREPEQRFARAERYLAYPVLLAVALVIPQLLLAEADPDGWLGALSTGLDWGIWTTFAFEALILGWLAPDRRAWVRGHVLDLVVVVLTPPFAIAALDGFRVLRLLRLVRLLRLAPLVRGAFALNALAYAAAMASITMLAGGLAFAEVEPDTTAGEGIYWALTTMTTVGYGDLSPTTTSGRLVAGLVMVVGIGFVATLTAAIADRLIIAGTTSRTDQTEGLGDRLDRIERQLAELASDRSGS